MPADAHPEHSWKQTFAEFTTPALPDLDLTFTTRLEPDYYYYSVLHHAVVKAKGDFESASLTAFLQEALLDFYDAHKGKQQVADSATLERAEALVPGLSIGRGGKTLRVDCSTVLKKDVATRLLLRRYGVNLEAGKRAFLKEAVLAKISTSLLDSRSGH